MKKSEILEKFQEYIVSKYTSEATLKTYDNIAQKFISNKHPTDLYNLTLRYIQRYLIDIKEQKSTSSYNQYLSVLKILYREVLNQKYKLYKIKPIKQNRKLKNLFTLNQILNVVNTITNEKHKAIILTLFSTGIRMAELLDVKISDVDSEKNRILIQHGKGNKSRFVPANDELLHVLRKYYKIYKPKIYLFGDKKGNKYSASSVNKVIKKHFGKQYHAHMFRHWYLTYMIEKDVNIKRIKLISGHSSDKSVEHYYQYTEKSLEVNINPINELAL
jgi:integrase